MIFKNNFYTIQKKRREGDSVIYSIRLNGAHEIYKGHFPGNPITPGVVQMEIIKELVSDELNAPIHLTKMPTCKFVAILNPEENTDIEIELIINNDVNKEYRAIAVIQKAEITFLKLSAYYKIVEN